MPNTNKLVVSVPPMKVNTVTYYTELPIHLTVSNPTGDRVVVEEVACRFASDGGSGTVVITADVNATVEAGQTIDLSVPVTPDARFSANTNCFDVKVRYRSSAALSAPKHEVFSQRGYLIISEPPGTLGMVFISIKQPEDEPLGRQMMYVARRAGFVPFLKAAEERPGDDVWTVTIEPALKRSVAVLVIWTDKTFWRTENVEKEIDLARSEGIKDVLLLENGCSRPDRYCDTSVEYTRFERSRCTDAFATVIDHLRQSVASGT